MIVEWYRMVVSNGVASQVVRGFTNLIPVWNEKLMKNKKIMTKKTINTTIFLLFSRVVTTLCKSQKSNHYIFNKNIFDSFFHLL